MQMSSVVHIEDVAVVDILNAKDERHRRISEHTLFFFRITVELFFHAELINFERIIFEKERHFLCRWNLEFGVMEDADQTENAQAEEKENENVTQPDNRRRNPLLKDSSSHVLTHRFQPIDAFARRSRAEQTRINRSNMFLVDHLNI